MTEFDAKRDLPDTADVIIVGAGAAGCVAAVRAQEAGCRTILIDKADEPSSQSNAVLSQGIIHIGGDYIGAPTDELERSVAKQIDGIADAALVKAFIDHRHAVADWLHRQDIKIGEAQAGNRTRAFLSPYQSLDNPKQWRDRGPDIALRKLRAKFVALGGVIAGGATATELLPRRDIDGIEGIVVQLRNGKLMDARAHAVLLADGGFQANRHMVTTYIGPFADQCKLRAQPTGTGDGIRMATAHRAQLVNMPYFYGHMLHRDLLTSDRLWPRPRLDTVLPFGVLVTSDGTRFVDEGIGGIPVTNAAARLSRPRDVWFVTDTSGWEDSKPAATAGSVAIDPDSAMNIENELNERQARFYVARTLDELGSATGINARRLAVELTAFNAAANGGNPAHSVPRSGRARPIETAPYYAVPVISGITFTMGGLLTDDQTRVLDLDNRPIRGLFAAGATVGGLGGGYLGGFFMAMTFGFIGGGAVADARQQAK